MNMQNVRAPSLESREDLSQAMWNFRQILLDGRRLPERLMELVRLRIAFHNQCRHCMSVRSSAAIADGLTEGLVCSLEKPADAPDMTEAERAAVAFADRFASDHLSIDGAMMARLAEHFDGAQIQELGIWCAFCTGFGRMGAVFDKGEELPVGQKKADGERLTPWSLVNAPLVM